MRRHTLICISVLAVGLGLGACTERNPANHDSGGAKPDAKVFKDGAASPEASTPDLKLGPEMKLPDKGSPLPDLPPHPDFHKLQDKAVSTPDLPVPTPDLPGPTPDLPPLPDYAQPPDQAVPTPDLPTTCTPPGYTAGLVQRTDKAGDWTVLLEPKTSYKQVTISGAKSKQAAATFDYNQAWQQVAGFVMSVPSSATDPATEAAGAIKAMTTLLYGTSTTDDAGIKTKTHDGFRRW